MEGERSVLVLHDERMTQHEPDSSTPFLADRLDRRVRVVVFDRDVFEPEGEQVANVCIQMQAR